MAKVATDDAAVTDLLTRFERTTDEVFTLDELRTRLASGRQLRMKYGVDLTAPDMHIGHAVNLWMYRALQDLGHKIVLLLGDFTTRIGDPTGRSQMRPVLPPEVIEQNAEDIMRQALSILRTDDEVLEIRRNSEWLDRLTAAELLSLMSTLTLDRLMSRDMFRKRAEVGTEIYTHELVYPLLQGYDSLALDADLTIIGTDQLFNEMMGRWLQERAGRPPQVVITTKITPGIDGQAKQSKSLGNYVGLAHPPREKFGRLMRLPDDLIGQYARVYTDVPPEEIEELEGAVRTDPMAAKMRLAGEIVRRYHGEGAAEAEQAWFTETFRERKPPADAPVVVAPDSAEPPTIFSILRRAFPPEEKSNSELRRLLGQRAVEVDGEVVTDPEAPVPIADDGVFLKVGKRSWFRVVPPGRSAG
jgi:tyrosyl-tRNA synthetase